MPIPHPIRLVAAALLTGALLSGCASNRTDDRPGGAAPADGTLSASTSAPASLTVPPGGGAPADTRSVNDPLEPLNRGIFWFNEAVDTVLIRPLAVIYKTVLPDPVQVGVRNVLQNLRAPLDLTNQLLQGDWDGAGTVTQRFVINSTVGLAGLIDVAAKNGLPYEYESFDQTLAVWGLPEGPYLVLPLLGPSSLRDGPALFAETLADPWNNYANNTGEEWFPYVRYGLAAVDTRAGYIDVIDDLKANSFDYYAAMRSLYRQRRDNWIRDGAPAPDQYPDIPDYED
ncbi:VacJ family lipoprotein [Rhodospirillum centenum]|uniref:VacJ like lipoprotein, putative n=1 Tax=Rhodospirillum centenum (strain ATCC 51521 / SW) TaxID=414684 RepID=B6IP23_RHOCS|nr:VacJ family lipoprotein [Rhodospirillum centenum]ACI99443.1 VacJ like lipoprotein, putative [Rhodospirillum centenum SW]